MTIQFYKTHTDEWFTGKTAKLLVEMNTCNGVISAGDTVEITGKSFKGGLKIRSDWKVYIDKVPPDTLQLID